MDKPQDSIKKAVALLSELSPLEQQLIIFRYQKNLKLKDIGTIVRRSEERIRQMLNEAEDKITNILK